MRITIATALLLTLATPVFASQNGPLYGSFGNPGVHCGPDVTNSAILCEGACMAVHFDIIPASPEQQCFREYLGTEPFDQAAPGEMKPKLGPERCYVRTR